MEQIQLIVKYQSIQDRLNRLAINSNSNTTKTAIISAFIQPGKNIQKNTQSKHLETYKSRQMKKQESNKTDCTLTDRQYRDTQMGKSSQVRNQKFIISSSHPVSSDVYSSRQTFRRISTQTSQHSFPLNEISPTRTQNLRVFTKKQNYPYFNIDALSNLINASNKTHTNEDNLNLTERSDRNNPIVEDYKLRRFFQKENVTQQQLQLNTLQSHQKKFYFDRKKQYNLTHNNIQPQSTQPTQNKYNLNYVGLLQKCKSGNLNRMPGKIYKNKP